MTRADLHLLADGRARFVGDLPLPPGCLHAAPVGSPLAHARFTRVDASAALAIPGVVAVLTAADVPGINEIGGIAHDEPLLADGETLCVAQVVALVLACDADSAWRAARLVDADFTPLPATLDLREAWAAGSVLAPPRTFAMGDVDAAWAGCAVVAEGSVRLGAAEHVYLEAQCALAVPQDDGGVVVHSSTQSPSAVQAAIARVTGLPMARVEVDVPRLGGGFGGKEDQAAAWACLAAVAALRLGRPVRLWLDRTDDMRMTGKRHPYEADFRIGVDKGGRIVAYEATLLQDAGCTTDLSPAILERSLLHATNAYAIDHVRVTAVSCRTNLPSNTAFRGFGAPQAMFVVEAAVRAAARRLGVAPETLQRRSLLRDGDLLPYGQRVRDPRLQEALAAVDARRPVDAVRAENAAWNRAHPRHLRGVALVPVCFGIAFTSTRLNQAEALVHAYADGTVGVSTGAVEMGQGVDGKLRTVAARTLGVDEGLVTVTSTNTRRVANVSPTAASTGADLNGAAAREACLRILAGLRPVAAGLLGCAEDEVSFGDGAARGPSGAVEWPRLVEEAYARRVALSALAHVATPSLSFDPAGATGHPFAYHVYGAALVEAEVDALLGTGRVRRVTVAHDVAASLDEATDLGQVEGAIVQGIGWMTTEEIVRDERGRLLSDSLATYKIPDLPGAPEIAVELLRRPNPDGLLGSKAVGEPPLVYGLGAFFALQDAIAVHAPAAAGSFVAPLTSERIFTLLHGDA